ncbi:hypothetical protein PI124_g23340, partial [Phytophthora idaei]
MSFKRSPTARLGCVILLSVFALLGCIDSVSGVVSTWSVNITKKEVSNPAMDYQNRAHLRTHKRQTKNADGDSFEERAIGVKLASTTTLQNLVKWQKLKIHATSVRP